MNPCTITNPVNDSSGSTSEADVWSGEVRLGAGALRARVGEGTGWKVEDT